jgi:hypothetical protein
MAEGFVNNFQGSLASAVGASDTTITLTSAAALDATLTYRLLCEQEIMVGQRNAGLNTLEVTRGAEGTTAASHSSGAVVVAIVTAGGLLAAIDDAVTAAVGEGGEGGGGGGTLTTENIALTAPVSLTPSSTWVDVLELELPAGEWLIVGQIAMSSGGGGNMAARLREGSTTLAAGLNSTGGGGWWITYTLVPGPVVLADTATVKLQALDTAGGTAQDDVVYDTTSIATQLSAIKVA